MSFSQVNNVNIVADARTIRCVIVITKYAQFLTDSHSRLGKIWNQILRNAIRQFAYFSCWMCTNWIEVAKDDTFEWSTGMISIPL